MANASSSLTLMIASKVELATASDRRRGTKGFGF